MTEWVRERQAWKCRVTVKVNKIKAGNLRASVLHRRCRRQRGAGEGAGGCRRQGWMSGLRCARARVRARVCSRVDLLVGSSPTLQATHCDRTTRALHSESGFTSHAVNGLKAAGPGTACTLLVCRRPPFQFIILHSFSHDEHKQP